MRLTSYLLIRLLYGGVLALGFVLLWSIVSGNHAARAGLERTSSSVARILHVQLIGFTEVDGLERGFPYWYPVTEVARPEGSCIRLFDVKGPLLRSSCSGRARQRLFAPRWFAHAYNFTFNPGATIKRTITGPIRTLVLEVIPDAEFEIEGAWHAVKALTTPAALLIGVLCLTVWWAVRRALTPARAIMRGLAEIERGALDTRLGPYPWTEFDRIAHACNALAASLAASNDARQTLSRQLLTVQEEERHALARELHDEFGQHLSAVGANAVALRGALSDPVAAAGVRRIENSAAHLMHIVRDLLLKLRPWSADATELPESLRALARHGVTSSGRRPRIEFDLPETLADLPLVLCAAIYRVVQEALTNALRHGDPGEIAVTLKRAVDGLDLVVDDNGGGCDLGALEQGLGVAGIRERVGALGGTVAFSSRNGCLSVSAHFPLQAPP